MAALTTCLRKVGDKLSADDRDLIRKASADYVDDGETTKQAAIHAVDDLLEMAIQERESLAAKIEARGGVVPDLPPGALRIPTKLSKAIVERAVAGPVKIPSKLSRSIIEDAVDQEDSPRLVRLKVKRWLDRLI